MYKISTKSLLGLKNDLVLLSAQAKSDFSLVEICVHLDSALWTQTLQLHLPEVCVHEIVSAGPFYHPLHSIRTEEEERAPVFLSFWVVAREPSHTNDCQVPGGNVVSTNESDNHPHHITTRDHRSKSPRLLTSAIVLTTRIVPAHRPSCLPASVKKKTNTSCWFYCWGGKGVNQP